VVSSSDQTAREVRAQCLGDDLLLRAPRGSIAGAVDLSGELAVKLDGKSHVQLDERTMLTRRCTAAAAGRPGRHLQPVGASRARHTVGVLHGHSSPRHGQRFAPIVSAGGAQAVEPAETSPITY